MKERATPDVIADLENLHQGVHFAMDNLIRSKNYAEAERLLRLIDERMTRLINRVKPIK